MREDLDGFMEQAGLDWIVARGYPKKSADVFYLCRGARLGHTTVLKRRGAPPFFVVGAMERDEARRAGLAFAVPNDYGAAELAELDEPPLEVAARLEARVLERHEVAGRVAFVGTEPIGWTWPFLRRLLELRPELEPVAELDQSAVSRARSTKSADEIERMRSVARRTEEVVELVLALLRGCSAEEGRLVRRAGGPPLKIGEVKDLVRLELARRNLDDHGETIFAVGREAGFPHSRGDERLEVRTGRSIIFDIFPQEKGGGYFFDMTRTYWIGEVAEATRRAYDAVREAFEATCAAARPGVSGRALDDLACDVLERHGYATKRSDPTTDTGYMHSLGHGVGLAIHERPRLTRRAGNKDVLEAGSVFTIEPGLYFPDEELGVRIEDTLYLDADGAPVSLATLPIDPRLDVSA